MGRPGGVVGEPGVEVGLQGPDGLVSDPAHLHAEDLVRNGAVEAFRDTVRLRAARLRPAALDVREIRAERAGVPVGAAELLGGVGVRGADTDALLRVTRGSSPGMPGSTCRSRKAGICVSMKATFSGVRAVA
jgi:hypothetical protein